MTNITDDCDNILAFLQAVAVKSPQVIADPLSLRTDKRVRVWFHHWTDVNLPTLPKPAPQGHMGLTGVLNNVETRLHTAEALPPVVAAQREAEKETKEWDRLPPTAQRVIFSTSPPPPTIHRFLNAKNVTALQADCYLTYAGKNIYSPTSLCHALLQGHILAIPDPDVPT